MMTWLVNAAPLWLLLAAILFGTLLLRGQLLVLMTELLAQRSRKQRAGHHELGLQWQPPTTTPTQVLIVGIATLLAVTTVVTLLASPFVALILAPFVMLLVMWGVLRLWEQRYRARLDVELPAAVGKLAASLRANEGIQGSLRRVLQDMPKTSPLRAEWAFLLDRQGVPLAEGGVAGILQVLEALLVQTPSERHRTFLGHLESVLQQDQSVILARVNAAFLALNAAMQRESTAKTQLAQMFYSGLAIGGAGIFMAVYLGFSQWNRFVAAYSGPTGMLIGVLVVAALAAPIVGGMLLSRAGDVDY